MEKFRDEYGYEILETAYPEEDENWRKFRWDSISGLVKKLTKKVKSYNKKVTAALFPTPEIARKLVRQNWSEWNLDAFYPMLYNKFYEEGIDWIKMAIGSKRDETKKPLHGGLYIQDYSVDELKKAVEILFNCNFTSNAVLF